MDSEQADQISNGKELGQAVEEMKGKSEDPILGANGDQDHGGGDQDREEPRKVDPPLESCDSDRKEEDLSSAMDVVPDDQDKPEIVDDKHQFGENLEQSEDDKGINQKLDANIDECKEAFMENVEESKENIKELEGDNLDQGLNQKLEASGDVQESKEKLDDGFCNKEELAKNADEADESTKKSEEIPFKNDDDISFERKKNSEDSPKKDELVEGIEEIKESEENSSEKNDEESFEKGDDTEQNENEKLEQDSPKNNDQSSEKAREENNDEKPIIEPEGEQSEDKSDKSKTKDDVFNDLFSTSSNEVNYKTDENKEKPKADNLDVNVDSQDNDGDKLDVNMGSQDDDGDKLNVDMGSQDDDGDKLNVDMGSQDDDGDKVDVNMSSQDDAGDNLNVELVDSQKDCGPEEKNDEVLSVEDDDKEAKESEDEIYFKTVSQEEFEWYLELGPSEEDVKKQRIVCTTCQKQITSVATDTKRHPGLGVVICKTCRNFYEDGDWTKDEDGFDEFCRWCGQGGDILLCDHCTHSFCKRCIQRNLGRQHLKTITTGEEWKCLICDPKPIYKLRAFYYTLSKINNYFKDVRSRKRLTEEQKARRREKQERLLEREQNLEKYEQELVDKPENFIDENISSAFKTLKLYQKALEDERKRWIMTDKNMSVEYCSVLVKNLRHIFSTTRKNMGLLDAALVQSYSKAFPKSKVNRISLAGSKSKNPTKAQKRKRKPVTNQEPPSKKKRNERPRKKNEIQLNGSPVTGSVDPSTFLEMSLHEGDSRRSRKRVQPSKRASSSSSRGTSTKNYKISTNMFNKKTKKTSVKDSNEDDDSDIQCVEEIRRPSIMKKKIGPKSKVRRDDSD